MREWWRRASGLGRAMLTFTVAVMLAAALFIAAMLWLPAIGAPSGEALRYSLMGKAGGSRSMGDLYTCDERPSGTRVCEVPDVQNSGVARYRVRMDGRCWDARKISPDHWEEQSPSMKRRVSGCVQFRDQLRLYDRFFGA